MFYSATTNGFYDATIHSVMPNDVVEITDAEHAALLTAQTEGKRIVADSDGRPEAIIYVPTADEAKAARIIEIKMLLADIDARKVRAIADAILDGDTTRLQELEIAAAALRTELAGL